MMLQQNFIKNIVEKKLFTAGDHLLLAVSGGVDSVVLCELCHQSKFSFAIAHVNFKLRGEESDSDEKFVRQLGAFYNVPVHATSFNTDEYSKKRKVSIQVAARELRYGWFNELIGTMGGYLLTAHHADDNIETVLMNFFRGTGISGLRGMRPATEKIIRPLLPFTKSEIIAFAKEYKLSWREDSSNNSEKYSRNYFRNTLIPMAARIFPEAEKNILENIRRFSDVETIYNDGIAEHKKKLLEYRDNAVHIPVLKLKKTAALHSVLFEIIRDFGFSGNQVEEVLHLLDADQGKMVISSTHRIIKNRKWLIITTLHDTQSPYVVIQEGDDTISFHAGTLQVELVSADKLDVRGPNHVAMLDVRNITFPLILRKWKKGDYFYPLGLGKKKKVARFLIDQKVSPLEKENTWVLESAKRICWVVGRRIDDRFKVGAGTREVLMVRYVSGRELT